MAPENTVEAFSHATRLGYRHLETDVHLTADGVLVAFHDSGLQRVAGLTGQISDHRWSELESVDLGSGAGIPTLDQLLEAFPSSHFNIDPKSDDTVGPLAQAIQRHGAVDRVGVGSFDDRRIRELQRIVGPRLCASPGPRRGMLLIARIVAGLGVSPSSNQGLGCVQIPPQFRGLSVTPKLVEGFHQLGLQVHVWTVNERDQMCLLLDMGVDGIITDDPSLLRDVLTERGTWCGT